MTAKAWVNFVALSVLWGTPYFMIKIALEDGLSPAFIVWARVAVGALVLLPLAYRAGAGQLRGFGRPLTGYAVLEISVPFLLITLAEEHLASSTTAIILSFAPLLVALFAIWVDPAERASGWRLHGLILGFLGVVLLVGADLAGRREELIAAGMVLLAAAGYAAGPILYKRALAGLDLWAVMAATLVISTVLLTPLGAANLPSEMPSVAAGVSVIALGVTGSAAALVVAGVLIREAGPGRAAVVAYASPVVAVIMGVGFLDEALTLGAIVGLVLIVSGSWLSTRPEMLRQSCPD